MKITATKVKSELVKKYGWDNVHFNSTILNDLVKDTLSVVNDILVRQKNISIKKPIR